MAGQRKQRNVDVRALMKMIGDANDDGPGPVLPWSLMDDLARLLPAEEVSIADLDMVSKERILQQDVLEDNPRSLEYGPAVLDTGYIFWRDYPTHWAGFPPSRAGQVRHWADRYAGRNRMENPLYRDFFRPMGRRYFMSIGLQAPSGHELNLMFWRHSGPDFSDRDRDLLTLLRPHVAEIYHGAVRRRLGVLTPREWEVLDLAAQGLSNADIAALLVTSVSTVRKHMEHIFDRTGARTRGAAVATMIPELRDATGRPRPSRRIPRE